ncbi:MAG: hypothetical protein MUD14_20285 [Hydrococcus sp. Prado102]|jgi:hypothetical protein|nr:hypothetical protein [Hydrococcus sp. Prado102]
MFLTELQPAFAELTQQPIAFLGGFVSGILKLNLADDPLKSWLEKQGMTTTTYTNTSTSSGNGSGPQSISID